jgi:hypothetical protein
MQQIFVRELGNGLRAVEVGSNATAQEVIEAYAVAKGLKHDLRELVSAPKIT